MRFLRDSTYGLSGWKEAKVARSAASLKVERVPVAEEFISSTPSMELEERMSEDKSKAPHDFTWKAQANDNEVPVNPGDMLPNRSDPMASLLAQLGSHPASSLLPDHPNVALFLEAVHRCRVQLSLQGFSYH